MAENIDENRSSENQSDEERRKEAASYGKKHLERRGIDADQYRKYFRIMLENDAPVVNHLPQFWIIEKGHLTVDEAISEWELIESIYKKIDLEKQDDNTGKKIIEEMKALIPEFGSALREWKDLIEKNPEAISRPSPRLVSLREHIVKLAREYGSLPAYVAYRFVGQYEVDSRSIPEGTWFRDTGLVKK